MTFDILIEYVAITFEMANSSGCTWKSSNFSVDKGGQGLRMLLFHHYAFSARHLALWALPPERAPPWYEMKRLSPSVELPVYQIVPSVSIPSAGYFEENMSYI